MQSGEMSVLDYRTPDPENLSLTLCCPECEEKFGTVIELNVSVRDRSKEARRLSLSRMNRFVSLHRRCGETELETRLARWAQKP